MAGSKVRAMIIPSKRMWDEICKDSEIWYSATYSREVTSAIGTQIALQEYKVLICYRPYSLSGYWEIMVDNHMKKKRPRIFPAYKVSIDVFKDKSLIKIFKVNWDKVPTEAHLIFQQVFYEIPLLTDQIEDENQLPGLVKTIAVANGWY